jgi:hypothetical protein
MCDPSFPSCREFISHEIRFVGKPLSVIAKDMGYSPSDLSRKLAQNPRDSRRFTLDDLEKYMQVTGDTKPVLYLVEKYLAAENPADLERRIAELQAKLKASQAA